MTGYKKLTPRTRLLDLLAIIVLVFISIVISLWSQTNFLFTTLLFFGLPSLYLVIRKPSNLKKTTIAALLFGVLWGFSFDFIAEFNQAWSWSYNSLLFPQQFLGVVSADIMVWFFLWFFLVIAFYEYFVEYDFSKKISPNIKYSIIIGTLALVFVVLLFNINSTSLRIPHAYLVLGLLALGQCACVVLRRPRLFPKLIEVVPFFIFLYLSFELVAVYSGLWTFPGQYIGMVSIQNLQFPIEEFIFWILASIAVAVSYYELFIDDLK